MGKDGGYKIALATQGTRGDFQPLLALACGLARAGHRLLIVGNPDHCKTAADFGFEAAVAAQEIKDVLQTEAGRKSMETGDLLAAMGGMDTDTDWDLLFEEAMSAFGPELLIHTALIGGQVGKYCAGKGQHVPTLFACYQPQMFPSEDFGPAGMYRVELEDGQPLISKWAMQMQFSARTAFDDLKAAKETGLDQSIIDNMPGPEAAFADMFDWAEGPTPQLLAYSSSFWPAPADWPKSGYHIVGRWAISREEQEARVQKGSTFFNIGTDLQQCTEFIRAGPPPVYIGWGSMTVYSNEHMATLAVDALRIAGRRGIIVAGWADVSAGSLAGAANADELVKYCQDNVLFMKAAPHEWLFPQCACCVHHGGVGTAQASLAAGSPTIVTPVFADQHDIAVHITKSGWGLGTERLAKLTSQDLGGAIRKVCGDGAMKAKVAALAEQMGKEDGVQRTLEIVESFMQEEVTTGKWAESKSAHKEKLRQRRKKNERLTLEQVVSQLNMELNKRYPALRAYNQSAMDKFTALHEKAVAGKLWYVKGKSCLVRAGEKLKSEEIGRLREFAFLEVLEQKGSRLHVQRLKGVGPTSGWVSTEVGGVEIVARVANGMEIGKLMAEAMASQFSDVLGAKPP